MANKLKLTEKVQLAQKYRIRFEAHISFASADLPLRKPIKLEIAPDLMSYTDGNKIHIGLDGLVCESEDEFITTMEYVIGHEIQHIRSSPINVIQWFCEEASRRFLRKAAEKIDGSKKRRLRKDSDYDALIKDLEIAGYKLKKSCMLKFFHRILNSVEDGRIEKIRSEKRNGYREKVALVRGKQWLETPCRQTPIEQMNAEEYLYTISNQILSLSTMSLYQKGFLDAYNGSKLHDKVKEVIPFIRSGLNAYSCKDNADQCLCIIDALSDEILEAVKFTPLDEILSNLLQELINDVMSKPDNQNMEEENNESSNQFTPFGKNEMDEDNSKNDSDSGMKASNDKQIENDNISKDKDKKNTETEESEESKSKSKNTEEENSDSTKENEDSKSSENSTQDEDSQDEDNSDTENDTKKDAAKPNNSDKQATEKPDFNENNLGGDSLGKSDANLTGGSNDAVKAAMKEAAKREISTINQIKESVKPRKSATPQVTAFESSKTDVKPNPKAENVKNLYPRGSFEEYKREYIPNLDMPYDLKGRSNTFKKKIINVIQNMIEPAQKQKKSGKLDGSAIHKLPMRQFDIFMRPKRVKKCSACCYMLCDNSGSMGYGPGSKREYLWKAIAEFEPGFSLLMPLKIVAFDEDDTVVHEVVKDWNERSDKSFAYNFLELGRSGCSNMDGYSISIATDEILRQNGKKKVLLVFSDGAPDSREKTKSAVDYARKCGITVIGIYFSNAGALPSQSEKNQFEYMYGDFGHAIVTSPEYIGEELYKVMKKEFL